MNNEENPKPRLAAEQEERKTADIMPMHHPIMRELAEPRDGFEPTPVWLVLIYFALIGWGGYYLASYSFDFRDDVYTDGPAPTLAGMQTAAPQVDPMVLGRRVYNNCTTCHGEQGQGVAGVFPPLAGSEFVNEAPESFARIVVGGLKGPLRVKGATYNGEMPSWAQLSDEQIAAVITYVRASFGNSSPAVPVETVTKIRAESSGRNAAWTEAELLKLAPVAGH